jgi:hypothetical protein
VEIAYSPRWMTLCAVPVDDVAVAYNLHTVLLVPSQRPGSDQHEQSNDEKQHLFI